MTQAVRDALDALPPWEAAEYFQDTKETVVGLNATPTLLVAADPMRVGLIFANGNAGVVLISTDASLPINKGFPCSSAVPPIILLFRDVGPLCQQAWYGPSSAGLSITVWEIRLTRWPRATVASANGGTKNGRQSGGTQRPGRRG